MKAIVTLSRVYWYNIDSNINQETIKEEVTQKALDDFSNDIL